MTFAYTWITGPTYAMLMSRQGNDFCITALLWGFNGHRACNAELWCFIWGLSNQAVEQPSGRGIETPWCSSYVKLIHLSYMLYQDIQEMPISWGAGTNVLTTCCIPFWNMNTSQPWWPRNFGVAAEIIWTLAKSGIEMEIFANINYDKYNFLIFCCSHLSSWVCTSTLFMWLYCKYYPMIRKCKIVLGGVAVTDRAATNSWEGNKCGNSVKLPKRMPWTSYQISKFVGCACTGNVGNVSPPPN